MVIYYIVFVFSLILSAVLPSKNNRQYLWKVIITFIPLFLFAALRDDFGLDYPTYESVFNTVKSGGEDSFSQHCEVGFLYILRLSPSWRFFVVISSLFICFAWGKLFYDNVQSKFFSFAILLFFCIGNFTIFTPLVAMRNGLTIAIMMLSFPFIVQRKYLLVLVIAIIGQFLHSSLLLFLPIALLVGSNRPFTNKELKGWMLSLLVLAILGSSSLLNLVTSIIISYFDRYVGVLDLMKETQHNSIAVNLANFILFGFVIGFLYKHKKILTLSENSYFRIGLIYLFCSFLGPLGGARTQAYFLPFFLLILVKMFSVKWMDTPLKVGFFLLIFAYFLYRFFYVWQWSNPYFVFNEYHSIL